MPPAMAPTSPQHSPTVPPPSPQRVPTGQRRPEGVVVADHDATHSSGASHAEICADTHPTPSLAAVRPPGDITRDVADFPRSARNIILGDVSHAIALTCL